ncbi:MAG: molybdopterin-synthase adenylyltransferase MoeB [Acidiferrobacterales bacterium]|nr:molybdopterin-synthase adenylyltransferase MoeB [Acidiferrobacterales bacterium]
MDDSILLRYNRQIMMTEFGIEGQQRIMDSAVLVVGLGGLGSAVTMYLAGSGVGHLVLNDFDTVDLSNLQRQIVHSSQSVGISKVESAIQTLTALNHEIKITGIDRKLSGSELYDQVQSVAVVVDATDNFDIRFALNEASVATRTPLVSGAAIRMDGQFAVYRPDLGDSPCFRCLYAAEDEPVERCSETGVLGSVCGTIGSLQATEVLKIIAGVGTSAHGKLFLYDASRLEWQEVTIPKDRRCPVCSSVVSAATAAG